MVKKKGKVFLIGAGPGDIRLLTLGAVECLQKADVIVYDRLADDSILNFASEDAELIYVGKASADHTMRQEDINILLADKAAEGKLVARLKGGDPFVFGRGGEESLVLLERGVPFEVISGVTSAISVPAYAGIPVTHRGVATSFAVITGHEDPTKESVSMRWEHLANGVDTLVFLMGVANIPKITANLIEHGRAADTPAAIIRWGTRPEQETYITTLSEAASLIEREGIKPPAIFIVGEVVRLRDKLRWFDNPATRPLFGKTVLVTRSRAQASELTDKLRALGAKCIEIPVIKLEPPADNYKTVDKAIEELFNYGWIIFTSVNAVNRFFDRLYRAGKDSRAFGFSRIVAVGTATAARLRKYGLNADIIPADFKAEGVVTTIKDVLPPRSRILIPRATEARDLIPKSLEEMKMQVTVAPVYTTVPVLEGGEELATKLLAGKIDFVTFTSSSTVKNLVTLLGNITPLMQAKLVAIGPVTAKTLDNYALEPATVASEHTIDGLVEALVGLTEKT